MTHTFYKLLFCSVLSNTCFPAVAVAQGVVGLSPQAPKELTMMHLGVDVYSSAVMIENNDISVGSGDFPSKLTLKRVYNSIGYPLRNLQAMPNQRQYLGFGQGSTHNLLAYFTRDNCPNNGRIRNLNAVVFGVNYHFSLSGSCVDSGVPKFDQNDDEGATIRIINSNDPIWSYELITRDGLRVIFADKPNYKYDVTGGIYASFAEFPNGEFIEFNYASSPSVQSTVRLTNIYNSRGYGLRFSYKTRPAYFSLSIAKNDSSLITSITSYKKSMSATTDLSTVYYTYDVTNYFVQTFSDSIGGLHRYEYDQGRISKVFLPRNNTSIPSFLTTYIGDYDFVRVDTFPGSISDGLAMLSGTGGGDNERPKFYSVPNSVKDGEGNITNYKFSSPYSQNAMSLNLTNPDGSLRAYKAIFCPEAPACRLEPYYQKRPSHVFDENGLLTVYSYDNRGRQVSKTNPEGDTSIVSRDANGNIIQVINKPKSGSESLNISSLAGYSVCTPSNYKYCNKPVYTIDPRGGRWDFQYDAISGDLAVSLAPANANGARLVTRYNYSTFNYGAVARPSLVNSAGVSLLTMKDTCLASTLSSGTIDFSYICPQPNRIREIYTIAPNTPSVSSSLEVVGIKPDADVNTAVASFTYDNVGNMTASTDLVGSTSNITYDLLRRPIFEIAPDPDGIGPLKRPIIRHVYDGNGNEIRTEKGEGLQTNGADFTIISFVRRTFNLNDQIVRIEDVTP